MRARGCTIVRCLALLAVFFAVTAISRGQALVQAVGSSQPTAPAPRLPDQYEMNVRPVATTRPALSAALMPRLIDQRPGNAAPLYLLALLRMPAETDGGDDTVSDLLDAPIDQMPIDKARQMLNDYRSAVEQADLAAQRERCDWELPIRQQGIATLLPHLNGMRKLARVLALKAKVEIAGREYDQAIRTLRTGFAMAQSLRDQALLIQGLVETGMAALLMDRVRELSEAPGAPNLYWALRTLPRPFIDEREIMRWEKEFVFFTWPRLKEVRSRPLTADQAQQMLSDLFEAMGGHHDPDNVRLMMVAGALRVYPAAKKHLAGKGRTAEEIAAMPAPQAIAIYLIETFEDAQDELWKWWLVPYSEARDGMAAAERKLHELRAIHRANPLIGLLPAISRARWRFAQLERRIAAMELVEAVKDHAAHNNGRLPAALAELKEPPAPLDPSTGKAFGYEVSGGQFTITSPAQEPREAMRIIVKVGGR